jgi:hypothetical protein
LILSIEERDATLKGLSVEQQEFLTKQLVRRRRTVFANAMVSQKGHHIPDDADPDEIESLLSEWVYTGYIDGGKVTPDLRCECGRPLRYQHQVKHKTVGEIKKFGIEHLKEHLGIDAGIVAVIKRGFDAIDYELDELLIKQNEGWQIDPDLLQVKDMPPDIMKHLKCGLPLLETQLKRLKQARVHQQIRKIDIALVTLQPPTKETKKNAKPYDLFSFMDHEHKKEYVPLFELSGYLQGPVLSHLKNGVRSARILCELLILENHASDARYITGKPHIYVSVCKYIESLTNVIIFSASTDDRYYDFR